jgi:hypothetical protein
MRTASETSTPTGNSASILSDLDDIAAHVDGALVVVVELTGGRYRRRCYLSAKAAEDAARRANEKGENATVYLATLKPIFKVRGGTR